MKFALSLYSLLDIKIDDIVSTSQYAEKSGLDYVVLGESAYRDVFQLLLLVGKSTRKIRLGTNIVPIYTRTPTQIAMSVNTLNEATGGRFDLLGLGRGGPMIIEPNHGVKVENSRVRMKEYIEIIREILDGKKVTYNGELFKIDNAWIPRTHGVGATTSELAKQKVSIQVGCQGPLMMRLAAAYADGIIFSTLSGPEYLKWAIDEIRKTAKKAGRNPQEIEIGCQIMTAVSKKPENVREAVRRACLYYLRGPQEKFNMEKSGWQDKHSRIRQAYLRGSVSDALAEIDDELIDRLAFAGTPDQVIEKIRAYEKFGISFFTLRSVVDEKSGTRTTFDNIDAIGSMKN